MRSIVVKGRIDEDKRKELEDKLQNFKGYKGIAIGYASAEIVLEEKEISSLLNLLKKMDIVVERVVEYV